MPIKLIPAILLVILAPVLVSCDTADAFVLQKDQSEPAYCLGNWAGSPYTPDLQQRVHQCIAACEARGYRFMPQQSAALPPRPVAAAPIDPGLFPAQCR